MDAVKKITETKLGITVTKISPLGKGASGAVFLLMCDKKPYKIAVKVSPHPELMRKEYEMLSFLKERTESKVPRLYYYETADSKAYIAMEYIEGVSGTDKTLMLRPGRKHLAESIISNLLLIQKAKNDKFGPIDNAVYDTWKDCYRELADDIYGFTLEMRSKGKLDGIVAEAVMLSYKKFDEIFREDTGKPTLIHGDYWMPNFIIDKKKMELKAAIDPFNMMWAEPEYELFAMTVGTGKKLKLYETYKSKVNVSALCDLKVELYALYSELLWYKKLGTISHDYLRQRSKGLIKQMKLQNII